MTSVRKSTVWTGAAFALNDASVGQVLTMPRFSPTKTRPFGAKTIVVGELRPVTTVSSTKPAARVEGASVVDAVEALAAVAAPDRLAAAAATALFPAPTGDPTSRPSAIDADATATPKRRPVARCELRAGRRAGETRTVARMEVPIAPSAAACWCPRARARRDDTRAGDREPGVSADRGASGHRLRGQTGRNSPRTWSTVSISRSASAAEKTSGGLIFITL